MFDDLVALFKARAAIPGTDEFTNIKPALKTTDFPRHILTDARLSSALADDRLARLRAALTSDDMAGPDAAISYVAPWFDDTRLLPVCLNALWRSRAEAMIRRASGSESTSR